MLLGLSPWDSPLALWQRKLGLAAEIEETEAMKWGMILQDIIAEQVHVTTTLCVSACEPYDLKDSTDHPHMICTPDGFLDDVFKPAGMRMGVLEVKTTNAFKSGEWEETPPEHYRVQVLHQMIVTGCRWGMLAVLIGGQELRIARIEWDQDMADKIIDACRTFWEYVKSETAPPADAMPATKAALESMHPVDDGDVIELPLEAIELDATIQQAQAAQLETAKTLDAAKNRLRQLMGDAAYGILPDQSGRWSWRTTKRKGFTVEPGESRVLRRLKL